MLHSHVRVDSRVVKTVHAQGRTARGSPLDVYRTPGPGLWLVGHITRDPGRFAAYSAWPLPRVLLVHLGDTLGMDPAAPVQKNVEGHLDLKPVIACHQGP